MKLSVFTCPNFHYIKGAIFVFFIARAEGLPDPCESDCFTVAGNFQPAQGGIVGGDGKRGFLRIDGFHAEGIALHVH